MNPNQNNEMVSTLPNDPITKEPHPVNQVTTFSKYLALALFVALPFIGAYVGYQLAGEKVVEVRMPNLPDSNEETKDVKNENGNDLPAVTNFTDDVFGFSFDYPTKWGDVKVDVYNGVCAKEVVTPCQERSYYFTNSDFEKPARFMVVQNNTFSIQEGDGKEGTWGTNARDISENFIDKCLADSTCNEKYTNSGVRAASFYGPIYEFGEDENVTKESEYMYYIAKKDINVGMVLSSQELQAEPEYQSVFEDTVIKSLSFLERY